MNALPLSGTSARVDRTQLDDATGGDQLFEYELLDEYIECTTGLLDQLISDLEANSTFEAGRVAHTLKGSSRTLGFTRMASLSEQIELGLASNQVEIATDALQSLSEEFDLAKNWVQANRQFAVA